MQINGKKRNLDGLYEVLAPSKIVGKINLTTGVKKETEKAEVLVRNTDIENFVIKEEMSSPPN